MRRPGGSRDLIVVLVAAAVMLLVAGATAVFAPPDEGREKKYATPGFGFLRP